MPINLFNMLIAFGEDDSGKFLLAGKATAERLQCCDHCHGRNCGLARM